MQPTTKKVVVDCSLQKFDAWGFRFFLMRSRVRSIHWFLVAYNQPGPGNHKKNLNLVKEWTHLSRSMGVFVDVLCRQKVSDLSWSPWFFFWREFFFFSFSLTFSLSLYFGGSSFFSLSLSLFLSFSVHTVWVLFSLINFNKVNCEG